MPNRNALWKQAVEFANATTKTEPTGHRRLWLGPASMRFDDDVPYRACAGVFRRLDLVNPGLQGIFRPLLDGSAKWPLFLHGYAGAGKTRAGLCLCDLVAFGRYWTVDELCKQELNGAAPWELVVRADLAVLDELGTRQRTTDLEYAVVYRFADLRERYHDGVAVYITNLEPKDIRRVYDDRIYSRVLCGTCFALRDPDRRMQEKS